MKDHSQHPLYYKERPTGLRLELMDGSIRHVASQYLEAHLASDKKTIDLYFGSAVIRIIGENLLPILEGLENEEHPLGRLSAITECPLEEENAVSTGTVIVTGIAFQPRLESDFPTFYEIEAGNEEEAYQGGNKP